MNMVKEWVVIFGFNKENPIPSIQQPHGQPNKIAPQKTKGAKLE
jgi:hypothetical protein